MLRQNNQHPYYGAYQDKHWNSTNYRRPDNKIVNAYISPKLKFISKYINLQNKSVLDTGCGNGLISFYLSKDYNSFPFGIDINEHLLRQNVYSPIIKGDSNFLPFLENSFDCVIEANLLHHVENPGKVISEMKRVSKEYVVFLEPNVFNPLMFLFSLLVKAERGGLKSTRTRLTKLVIESGLSIIGFITMGMISQNNTPGLLVPILKYFDFNFFLGEYHIIVCKKS